MHPGKFSERSYGSARADHEPRSHGFGRACDTNSRYFKNSPTFFMNLQTRHDLEVAEDEIAYKVERDVSPLDEASSR